MPTALEMKLIHVAYRQAGLDEAQYRMVLRNVAGVDSAKSLSQVDLENVMAVFEDGGFRHAGKPADCWRAVVARRGSWCGERQVYLIEELAKEQPYDLAGMCRRFSGDRASRPDKLYPREASKLIEALKAICWRQNAGDQTSREPGEPDRTKAGAAIASASPIETDQNFAAEAAGGSPEPLPGARMPLESKAEAEGL